MSDKQKAKNIEGQPDRGGKQEIPTYGGKSQNQKPEMGGKNCRHGNCGQ